MRTIESFESMSELSKKDAPSHLTPSPVFDETPCLLDSKKRLLEDRLGLLGKIPEVVLIGCGGFCV